jgi:hypothetical protein
VRIGSGGRHSSGADTSVLQQTEPEMPAHASTQGEREPEASQPVDGVGFLWTTDPDRSRSHLLDQPLYEPYGRSSTTSGLVAFGTWTLAGWDWILTVLVMIIRIAAAICVVIVHGVGTTLGYQAIVEIVISAFILWYFLRPNIRAAFGRTQGVPITDRSSLLMPPARRDEARPGGAQDPHREVGQRGTAACPSPSHSRPAVRVRPGR